MAQHKTSPQDRQDVGSAQIVDFEAAKAARLDRRMAANEAAAEHALSGVATGQMSAYELMRALVAPFNNDPL